ncbi:helix-turn-helix domain-containing protein [Yinghuangia aomiensis]
MRGSILREMASSRDTAKPPRRRRADAQRSIDAILDAARRLLGDRLDVGMEDIAAAAGVTRQTVYAHFPSRDAPCSAPSSKPLPPSTQPCWTRRNSTQLHLGTPWPDSSTPAGNSWVATASC